MINWANRSLPSSVSFAKTRESAGSGIPTRLLAGCRGRDSGINAADKLESGLREILDFGHTLAHALETLSDCSQLNQGEAVAIGMIMAARLSDAEGWIQESDPKRIEQLITRLPVLDRLPKGLTLEGMLEAFQSDKKTRAGRLRFVLTRGLGLAETSERRLGGSTRWLLVLIDDPFFGAFLAGLHLLDHSFPAAQVRNAMRSLRSS